VQLHPPVRLVNVLRVKRRRPDHELVDHHPHSYVYRLVLKLLPFS
jgi:hypothetical protein